MEQTLESETIKVATSTVNQIGRLVQTYLEPSKSSNDTADLDTSTQIKEIAHQLENEKIVKGVILASLTETLQQLSGQIATTLLEPKTTDNYSYHLKNPSGDKTPEDPLGKLKKGIMDELISAFSLIHSDAMFQVYRSMPKGVNIAIADRVAYIGDPLRFYYGVEVTGLTRGNGKNPGLVEVKFTDTSVPETYDANYVTTEEEAVKAETKARDIYISNTYKLIALLLEAFKTKRLI